MQLMRKPAEPAVYEPEYTPASADPSDPVCSNAKGWWFWNEVWADVYGPYADEAAARAALAHYVRTEL